MSVNEPLLKEVKEQEPEGKQLPTIDEELARIFPDSADKFLKPAKKRGRPRKYPKTDIKNGTKRGRGRPRKTDPSSLISAKKKSHGKVGRPRKNPLQMTADTGVGVPVSQSVLHGKVGRPRKVPLQMTADTSVPVLVSHLVSGGKVGRPRKIPLQMTADNSVPLPVSHSVSHGKVGRPRKVPLQMTADNSVPVPASHSVSHGKVGRPRKIPLQMTADNSVPVPASHSVPRGKVGRPRKIPLQMSAETSVPVPDTVKTDLSKREWPFDSSTELHKLRKKPRLSYVEALVEDYDEDDVSDDSLGNSHSENGSYIESESGFESDNHAKVETKKRKRKISHEKEVPGYKILKSEEGQSGYSILKIAGPKRGRGRPRKDEILKRTLIVKLERLSDLNIDMRNQNASFMVKDLKNKSEGYLLPDNNSLRRKPGHPKKDKSQGDVRPENSCLRRKPGRPKKMKGQGYVLPKNSCLKRKPGRPKKEKGQGFMLAQNNFLKRRPGRPKMVNGQGCLLHVPTQSNFLKRKRGRPKKFKVGTNSSETELDATCSNLTSGKIADENMTTVCVRVKRLDEVNLNQFNKTVTVSSAEVVEDALENNVTEDICKSGKPEDIGVNEEMGEFSLNGEVDNLQDMQNFYLSQEVVSPTPSHKKRGRPKKKETSIQKSEKKRGRPRKEDTMPKRPRGRPKKFLKKTQAIVGTQTPEDTGSVVTEEVSSLANLELGQTKPQDHSSLTPTLGSPVISEVESPTKDRVVPPVEPKDRVLLTVEPKDRVVPPVEPKNRVVPTVDPRDSSISPGEPKDRVVHPVEPKDKVIPTVDPKDSIISPVEPKDGVVPPIETKDRVNSPVEPLRTIRRPGRPKKNKRGCWRKISENSKVVNTLEETRGMELTTSDHDINIEEDINCENLNISDRCCLTTGESLSDSNEILKKSDQEQCSVKNSDIKHQVHGTSKGYSMEINDTYSSSDSEDGKTLNKKQPLSDVLPVVNGSPTRISENSLQTGAQLFDSEHLTEENQTVSTSWPEADLSVAERGPDTQNVELYKEDHPPSEHTVSDPLTDSERTAGELAPQSVSGKVKTEFLIVKEENQSASEMSLNVSGENHHAERSPDNPSESDMNKGKNSPVCKSQIGLTTCSESGLSLSSNRNQSVENQCSDTMDNEMCEESSNVDFPDGYYEYLL